MSAAKREPSRGTLRIGMSGWTYPPWRGTFYPKGLAQRNELAYASAVLPSLEINGTFYGLQRPGSYGAWYDQTPPGFVFSVKGPRFITHVRRLRDVGTPVINFLLSGPLRLGEKLGPILWQLPPTLKFDADLVETFLALLPRSTDEAAGRVGECDARMKGRTWTKVGRDRPLRHAVEIRHDSFATPAFVTLLRKYKVALVSADTGGQWPMLHDVTADFVYCRMHGVEALYASGYTQAALDAWAKKIIAWSAGGDAGGAPRVGPSAAKRTKRDVFVYFDNDVKVRSPFDAARLAATLGVRDAPIEEKKKPADPKKVPAVAWGV